MSITPTVVALSEDATTAAFNVYARSCAMGLPYDPKENQDRYCVFRKNHDGNEYVVAIVCDGHGNDGSYFAQTVLEHLRTEINKQFANILAKPNETLQSMFDGFNEDLEDNLAHQGFTVDGGTTATVFIQTGGRCIVANVGDCEVHIKLYGDVDGDEKTTSISCLTEDHSGESDSEIYRVMEHAGCHLVYAQQPSLKRNGVPLSEVCQRVLGHLQIDEQGRIKRVPFNNVPGVYYMNVRNKIATYFYCIQNGAKLACGRSFGDYSAPFVTAIPSVRDYRYPPNLKTTAVLGSDGYFNCLTERDLHGQLNGGDAKSICDTSIEFVEKTFGFQHADNMTVVAIECQGKMC